jgi:hypothetical protein
VPAFDGGDDFIGVGGPDEGLGIMIGLFDEAVDRSPFNVVIYTELQSQN